MGVTWMTIEAVTFDLWDTLVHNKNYGDYRLPELDRILRSCGITLSDEALRGAYMSGFRYSSRVIPAECYKHVETHEIVDKVLETVGISSPEAREELVKIYEEAILCDPPQLKEGVFGALDYVEGRYKIGLVSVTGVSPGRIIRTILRDHGILDYFDVLTFSDEVKLVKPNPGLFKACLKELKVAPEKAVHVGDSFKRDIVGAIDAGMRTIWVKTREQEQKPDYIPDGVIGSLLEFPDALSALE
jgi:putative hydrolase of the HAD superfamily